MPTSFINQKLGPGQISPPFDCRLNHQIGSSYLVDILINGPVTMLECQPDHPAWTIPDIWVAIGSTGGIQGSHILMGVKNSQLIYRFRALDTMEGEVHVFAGAVSVLPET